MTWSEIVSSGITVEEQIEMSHESNKVETQMYLSSLNNQENMIQVNQRVFPIDFLYSQEHVFFYDRPSKRRHRFSGGAAAWSKCRAASTACASLVAEPSDVRPRPV